MPRLDSPDSLLPDKIETVSERNESSSDLDGARLRIAIFAEYAGEGGPYHYLQRLTRLLVDEGHDVTVIPFIPNSESLPQVLDEPGRIALVRPENWFPSALNWLPREMTNLIEARRISRWLSKSKKPFDIAVFSVCLLGRFFWPRFSKTLPIYIFHSYPKGTSRRPSGPLFRLLIGRCARLVALSDHTARQIETVWGISRRDERMTVIPSTSGAAISSSRNSQERDSLQVLMVGTITEEKNPLLWVDIAHDVLKHTFDKPVVFRWVGEGPLRASCEKRAMHYGIHDSVIFSGFDSQPEPHYLSSDVYLHVSGVETMSLAALDSAKFGVPAVVSATGGLPEIVSDGQTGFVVDSAKPSDFATKVTSLLRDSELRAAMSEKARKHYASHFSESTWQSAFRKLISS